MNISRFSVYRPVFTIMVFLIIIILGGVSLQRLPIDLMPDITIPTLSVSARYENAGPLEVEELVTRPLEEALSAVPGVEEISSVSSEGSSSVRVSFTWSTDLDAAANDIRDRIDRAMRMLPEDADRPMLRKFDLASFPVLILGAYSDLDPIQMREIIEDQIKYRIERVPGVASLSTWGGLDREIHVDLIQNKIKSVGVTVDQILASIRSGNVSFPAGNIEQGDNEIMIRTSGEFTSLDELKNIVVTVYQGAPVRIGDLAEIEDSFQDVRRIIRVNGKPGFRMAINKQSGTNTVQVAQAVMKELGKINLDFPQIQIIPIIDSSDYIERAINNMTIAAVSGGTLAVLVLLFFLRRLKSTLIVATAIPTAVIGTFGLMYFSGFTLNIMTLGGMALGVGMLMDNSIVVIENIFRLKEKGKESIEAAVNGSEEVTSAIIASTLTTVAVFLPLVFVRGMAGVMFTQLAIVVSFALLCSLVVALTLVPMLSGRVSGTFGHEKGIQKMLAGIFAPFEKGYSDLLAFSLDHKFVMLALFALIFTGALFLIPFIGAELMPAADEGEVRVYMEMKVGTRLGISDSKIKEIEEMVRKEVPEIDRMVTSVGSSHWRGGGGHEGRLRISLVPVAERKRSSDEIADLLRKKLSQIPGLTVRTRSGQGLFIMRRMTPSGERINIEIRGHDLKEGDRLAQEAKKAVEGVKGVTDVRITRDFGTPERTIHVDRQKAGNMKVTVSQVADLLQTVLAGSTASYYREGGKEYRIRVRLKDAKKLTMKDILDLSIRNAEGEKIALRNIISVKTDTGPVSIDRIDQERVVSCAVNISDRDMGSVAADIRERLQNIPKSPDFNFVISGDYEEQQKAFKELLLSFILAIVLVYMVMACQFESLMDPFVVMFSVPLAAIGVIIGLLLTGTTFNIQSFIGCIMLAGIVVNNAILLVDHTNLLRRRENMPLRQAIEEAGRRRFRPILMTAGTTVLGLMPLAIGLGEGGEAQAPLARAVIGGLLSSAIITPILVPIIYSLFEKTRKKDGKENNPSNEEKQENEEQSYTQEDTEEDRIGQ